MTIRKCKPSSPTKFNRKVATADCSADFLLMAAIAEQIYMEEKQRCTKLLDTKVEASAKTVEDKLEIRPPPVRRFEQCCSCVKTEVDLILGKEEIQHQMNQRR